MTEVKRIQKKITVTEEQLKFIDSNLGKMSIGNIAKMLGIGYNKLYNNLRVSGRIVAEQPKAKVVNFDRNGYFDVDKFGQLYNF